MKINQKNNNIDMQAQYNINYNNINYNNIIVKDEVIDNIKDKNDALYDEKEDSNVKKPEQINMDISKLFGLDENTYNNKIIPDKQSWKYCTYCDKYHGKEFYMQKLDYCIHCWAWFNMNEINLETGKYTGDTSFDVVKTFIKKVYPVHLKEHCSNKECIFNKITELSKNNKLNIIFSDLLFEKSVKQEDQVVSVNINIKNHKLNINFDKSEISI